MPSDEKETKTEDEIKKDSTQGDKQETAADEGIFAELTFSTLILSLSTSVLVSLGELPDPLRNEKKMNLPLAKQTIGIIEMLKEKTKGNLTEEEDRLINNILFDLRLKYVNTAR
ncbi:MAG TPA: DUF1844 domain-containing protein [Deltaproteobacteria bacterium]|nr:DUF1844 domain-containing protein [Deltaproteobacteria bacterium]